MTLAENILDGIDIVDIVGRHVALQRSGANYKGLCPFHGEKSPSFVVSPQKQIFKCFGCGEGGDAITFIKKIENVDFIDAARILSKDAGVDLSQFDSVQYDKGHEEWKDKLKRLNKLATHYFIDQLKKSPEAIAYVKDKRKLSAEIVKKFQLGYSPDNYYDALQHLLKQGYSREELVSGSLAKHGSGSDDYSFFRGRLMFPIWDHVGNVVGFGGRAMKDDQQPKYMNTTDTVVYDKSSVLYGLNFVRQGIKEHDFVVVVEGYMDVIAMSRLGFDNAVATCGTSLTDGHFKLLKRYTEQVHLLFDKDKAGFAATKRALKVAYKYDVYPTVLRLDHSDAKDLDDVANLAENGEGVIHSMIERKVDGLEYVVSVMMKQYSLSSPVDKKKLLDSVMELLVYVTNVAIQDHYLGLVSDLLSMPKQVLEAQLKQYVRKEGRVLRKEMQQKQLSEKSDYKIGGELLLISLLHGHDQLTPPFSENLAPVVAYIHKVGQLLGSDHALGEYLTDNFDGAKLAEVEHLWLWWESEFERFSTVEEKLQWTVKTLLPELQVLVQHIMKYTDLAQEQKMALFAELRSLLS